MTNHPLPKPDAKMSFAIRMVAWALCAVFFVLVWSKSMSHGISHDEHQFIAPAVLLAKEGLLPYRDFPMFHLPNLMLIYSVFARFTDYYLLSATAFCAVCAWILVCLVFARSYAWLEIYRPSLRLLITTGFAVMLLTARTFIWSTGRAWNHDFPVLMVVVAFLLHLRAERAAKAWPSVLLSGFSLGLAIGGRVTHLPLIAPFGLAIFLFRSVSLRQRMILAIVFGAAVLVALLPSFYFFWKAPEAFIFDNFKYPRLRLLDPTDVAQKTFTVQQKWRFLWKWVARPNWPIFTAFFALGLPVIVTRLRYFRTADFEVVLLALLFPFILQGCVSPTRTHEQHFYSLIPFVVLAAAYGFSRLNPATMRGKLAAALQAALVIASVALGFARYKPVTELTTVSHWGPVGSHLAGIELKNRVGGGKVLTFAPIVALEGGLHIYPELATGPFAVRTAHLVTDNSLRKRLKYVSNEDLPAFLANDPPSGIVLGEEPVEAEAPFLAFAQAHGYRLLRQAEESRQKRAGLWVKPD